MDGKEEKGEKMLAWIRTNGRENMEEANWKNRRGKQKEGGKNWWAKGMGRERKIM